MSISYPRADLMETVRLLIQAPGFRLVPVQEVSRLRSGQIRGKNYSEGIWKAAFATPLMSQDECIDFESMTNDLEDGLKTFQAVDERRPMPLRHQNGLFNDTGQIDAITDNGRTITIAGLNPNFQISRGDKFRLTNGSKTTLHEFKESVTASFGGVTAAVTVQPNIPPEVTSGNPISLKRPYCLMVIEPGSVSYNPGAGALGTVTFSGVQYI